MPGPMRPEAAHGGQGMGQEALGRHGHSPQHSQDQQGLLWAVKGYALASEDGSNTQASHR